MSEARQRHWKLGEFLPGLGGKAAGPVGTARPPADGGVRSTVAVWRRDPSGQFVVTAAPTGLDSVLEREEPAGASPGLGDIYDGLPTAAREPA